MKNKLLILGAIMLLMIACRYWLYNSPHEIPAVAGINLLSLLIVFLSLKEHMKDVFRKKIEATCVPKEIIQRETNAACKRIHLLYLPLAGFAVLYYLLWICELGNDIIAIVALFLSLVEVDLAVVAIDFYMGRFVWKT